MSPTTSVRLTKELAEWLEEAAARSAVSQGRIVREQLEKARANSARPAFMRLAGSVRITVDEADFRVYRRNKRDVIPLICPPRA